MYIRNAWYVAALGTELGDALLMRRILGEQVLLFRDQDGRAAALDNRCPHRFAPLSAGRKKGALVECRYHGLQFDRSGACVGGLGGHTPAGVTVRSYPVEERHGLIWIWTGDVARADPAEIADLSFMTTGPGAPVARHILMACDYRLATDNLMDLSHAAVLHDETLGLLTPDLANGKLSVERMGNVVHASTAMKNVRLAPDAEPVDQWISMRWHPPGAMVIQLIDAPLGSERPPFRGNVMHVLTPETETTTHYFTGSPVELDLGLVRDPFIEEDGPMLAACQTMMAGNELWDLHPLILPTDAGGVGVRGVIEQLIKKEQAQGSA